jgi:hypothetical protein
MMIPSFNRTSLIRALGVVVGVTILIGANTAARAFEIEEDDMPDVKLFRGLLKSLGVGKDGGIDYRERSPLVVPPSRNLPPPGTSLAEKNPAWPVDPEKKKSKTAKTNANKPGRMVDESMERVRPLRPNENPRANGSTQSREQIVDLSNPMKPNELGYKGGLLSSILNQKENEYGTFVGEQPRTSLIEPPPGYRTPSPTQPYGVGKEKYNPTAVDRMIPQR